jgi:heat shock protein HslJ
VESDEGSVMRGTRWATAAVATALLAGLLTGCATATVSGGGSKQVVTGTWRLVRGTDYHGAISPGTANVTLRIDGTSSGGRGPCNAFGAVVSSATTGALTIRMGITTEMACAQGDVNTTEAHYFGALRAVTTASLAGGRLTLTGGGDTLVFARAAP